METELARTLMLPAAVVGLCLVLDALVMACLKGKFRAERTHYILSVLSVVVYVVAFFQAPAVFRTTWLNVALGLYVYDACILLRDWRELKPSYRVFYATHHAVSFAIFGLWAATWTTFTPAMAVGAVLWMSSDVWRWLDQISRLGGRHTPPVIDRIVFRLERTHRIVAYVAGIWAMGWVFRTWEETSLFLCALVMDALDTAFQIRAARQRRAAARMVSALCRDTELFRGLDNAQLDRVADLTVPKHFADGSPIVREGDRSGSMFFLTRGEVVVSQEGREIRRLGPGDVFGEMTLLAGGLRTATVTAKSPVAVAELSRRPFLQLTRNLPAFREAMWTSHRRRHAENAARAVTP